MDCLCSAIKVNFSPKMDNFDSEQTSSEDEDYFEDLFVDIKPPEFQELRNKVSHPLVTIKPIIKLWDNRMGIDEIEAMKKELIFSAEDYENVFDFKKKTSFLMALPYSYFPLRKKPINSKDAICAPLYMNQREVEKFCAPPIVNNEFFGKGRYGMTFRYDLENTDEKNNKVEKIMKI